MKLLIFLLKGASGYTPVFCWMLVDHKCRGSICSVFFVQSPLLTGQQCHSKKGPGRTWLCFRLYLASSINKQNFSNRFATGPDIGCASCYFHQPWGYLDVSWEITSISGLKPTVGPCFCYRTHTVLEACGPLTWACRLLLSNMQCPGRSWCPPGLGECLAFSEEGQTGRGCGLGGMAGQPAPSSWF